MSNGIPPKAPIQVFDASLNFLGEVDTYESLDHTRGWNGPGDWSCAINWNIFDDTGLLRYASLFAIGGYITIGGNGYKNGIINTIDKPIDSEGKQSQVVTISGTEVTGIFGRRLLNPPAGADVYALSAPAESIIKTIISDQCGSTATNTKRKFPLLTIAVDQGRGDNYLISNAYTNLLDELSACSIATLLGYSIFLDRANKQLTLDCALGNNLIAGQPNNAIFSTDYDTLLSADLNTTNEQFCNLATVTGEGQGATRPILDVYNGTEPGGFDRFETYVNANDVKTTPGLTLKGQAQLGTYQYTSTLEGMCLAKSPLIYQTNYNLGDFVTIKAYDYSLNKQITAVQESWGNLAYDLTPTFDKAPATITSQMANSSANLGAQVSKLGNPAWQPYPAGTYVFPSGNQVLAAGMLPIGATTTAPAFGTGGQVFANYRDNGSSIDLWLNGYQTAAGSVGNGNYLIAMPLGKLLDSRLVLSYIGNFSIDAGTAPISVGTVRCYGYSTSLLGLTILWTSSIGNAGFGNWSSALFNLNGFAHVNFGGTICGIPIQ